MTTLHTEVLKPCPCCNASLPEMSTYSEKRHAIKCTECPIRAEFFSSTREQAIDAWNRRATPQPDAAAIRKTAWEQAAKFVGPIIAAETSMPLARIDKLQDAIRALSTTLVEPAKNFCPDCGQRNNGDLVHTCSPQTLDAIRSATQDAPLAINVPEGYALVPIEPTEGMIEYGKIKRIQLPVGTVPGVAMAAIYRAMLAASPKQSKDA